MPIAGYFIKYVYWSRDTHDESHAVMLHTDLSTYGFNNNNKVQPEINSR